MINYMNELEVFQVYKTTSVDNLQYLDGRLLNDMDISREYYIIYNSNNDGNSKLNNQCIFKSVKILKIISYGKTWEYLHGGMTARLECDCDIIFKQGDIIYCK